MEEVAVLGYHEEDQAVDEAEKLVEVVGEGELAGLDLGAEVGVRVEKARAEELQRLFHLTGKAVAGGLAFPCALVAPAFQRAVGGGGASGAEAGVVDQKPERGEGGDVFGGENLAKVRLDMGGAGKGRVVAHEAQVVAIDRQTPESGVLGVQVVLHGIGGRARAVQREKSRTLVERVRRRADGDGDAAVAS